MSIAPALPTCEAVVVDGGARDGASDGGGGTVPACATAGLISQAVPTNADVMRKWRRAISDCCADMLVLPVMAFGVRHASLGRGESKRS